MECPQNCQDGYCDIVDGTCFACKHGFIGPRCMGKSPLYTAIYVIFITAVIDIFYYLLIYYSIDKQVQHTVK